MKRHVVLAVALFAFAGAQVVHTQRGAGSAGRGSAQTRLWWVAKAAAGEYGTNKPHIKLTDLKARHQGQPNWTEVVVDDENFHAEYSQGAPGFKIGTRMRPDTREFFAV